MDKNHDVEDFKAFYGKSRNWRTENKQVLNVNNIPTLNLKIVRQKSLQKPHIFCSITLRIKKYHCCLPVINLWVLLFQTCGKQLHKSTYINMYLHKNNVNFHLSNGRLASRVEHSCYIKFRHKHFFFKRPSSLEMFICENIKWRSFPPT